MTIHTATYSPEDNKIRLYASARLDAETYAKVKAAGFTWAPKQELFVAPAWSPKREDLAIELAGELQPEQMTMAERAQAKAERLEGYAHKRHNEANAFRASAESISERFAMGQPILMGRHGHEKPATLVALVPITFQHPDAEHLETLPPDTFSTAKVHTKIIRIEKGN